MAHVHGLVASRATPSQIFIPVAGTNAALDAAIQKAAALLPPYLLAKQKHTAAEEAFFALPQDVVPVPTDLIAPTPEAERIAKTVMVFTYGDGREQTITSEPTRDGVVLDNPADILAHHGGDREAAKPTLRTFRRWRKAVNNAPRAKADYAVQEAEAVQDAAFDALKEACSEILAAPVATASEALEKQSVYREIMGDDWCSDGDSRDELLTAARADFAALAALEASR